MRHAICRKAEKVSDFYCMGFFAYNNFTMTCHDVVALFLVEMSMIFACLTARHDGHQIKAKIRKTDCSPERLCGPHCIWVKVMRL